MRIVFVGCVKSSELFLKKLLDSHADIVGVVTKKESKFNADFVDLGPLCEQNNLNYRYVKNTNESDVKKYIKELQPDVLLCLGWSQLIDEEILHMPSIGCIGFHPAELPYNRGRHPLIWALALGLKETASSLFFMTPEADTGDVISQKKIAIAYEDDAMSLYDKVMEVAVEQLQDVLDSLETGTLQSKVQNVELGNTWRKRGKCDGQIDWRMSSRSIYNLVRALTRPYVGAHFEKEGQEYKVWKVQEIISSQYDNIEPGKVVYIDEDKHYVIKAGENLVKILESDNIELNEGEYL